MVFTLVLLGNEEGFFAIQHEFERFCFVVVCDLLCLNLQEPHPQRGPRGSVTQNQFVRGRAFDIKGGFV